MKPKKHKTKSVSDYFDGVETPEPPKTPEPIKTPQPTPMPTPSVVTDLDI